MKRGRFWWVRCALIIKLLSTVIPRMGCFTQRTICEGFRAPRTLPAWEGTESWTA